MAHPTAAGGGAVRPLVPGLGGSCVRQYRRPGLWSTRETSQPRPVTQGSRRAPCGLLEPPRGACGGLVAPAPARCARGLWGLSGLEQVSLWASRSGARGASPVQPWSSSGWVSASPATRGSACLPRRGGAATRCERTACYRPRRGRPRAALAAGPVASHARPPIGRPPRPPSVALLHRAAASLVRPGCSTTRGPAEGGDAPRLRVRRLGSSPFFPVKVSERTRRFSGVV